MAGAIGAVLSWAAVLTGMAYGGAWWRRRRMALRARPGWTPEWLTWVGIGAALLGGLVAATAGSIPALMLAGLWAGAMSGLWPEV